MKTNFDAKTKAIFLKNWFEAIRTAKRLQLSLRRLKASFPLLPEALLNPSDDLLDGLDAFRVRYADLQDCIGNKLFRGILLLEEESESNMLDTLNKMEKRGILTNVSIWREQRAIRNSFAHDYPDTESDKAEALNHAWLSAPELITLLKEISNYFKRRLSLDISELDNQ